MKLWLALVFVAGCSVDAIPFGGSVLGGADGSTLTRGTGGDVGGAAGVANVGGIGGSVVVVGTGDVTSTGGAIGAGGTASTGGAIGTGGVTSTSVSNCTEFVPSGPGGAFPHPGPVCSGCHKFTAAGTVYGDGYDPQSCLGINGDAVGGVQVLIYGADLKTRTLPVDSSGNFWTDEVIPFPATVSVVRENQKRAMVDSLLSGDCNSCHTATGKPGRVVTP